MSRCARDYSKTGIYHIMFRGNERKELFFDEEDCQRLIETVFEKAEKEKAEVYAYCLMNNHVHLLIGDVGNNLATLMKRISVSYVYYFNRKYKRIGHLFQDRFRSEAIETDAYILEAIRYIHNNPVKAQIARTPADYRWSSFQHYVNPNNNSKLNVDMILNMFSNDRKTAVQRFLEFSNKFGEFQFIELEENTPEEKRKSKEQEALQEFQIILGNKKLCTKDLMTKENLILRNEIIDYLKAKYNLSVRQMEKVTGIGRGTVLMQYQRNQDVNKNRP